MATEQLYTAMLEVDPAYGDSFTLEEFNENYTNDEGFAEAVNNITESVNIEEVKKKDESDSILEEEVGASTTQEEEVPTSSESLEESREPSVEEVMNTPPTIEPFKKIPEEGATMPPSEEAQSQMEALEQWNNYQQVLNGMLKQAKKDGTPVTPEMYNEARRQAGMYGDIDQVPVYQERPQIEEGGFESPLNRRVWDALQKEADKAGRNISDKEDVYTETILKAQVRFGQELNRRQERTKELREKQKKQGEANAIKRNEEVAESLEFKKALENFDEMLTKDFKDLSLGRQWDKSKLIPQLNADFSDYGFLFEPNVMGGGVTVFVPRADGGMAQESFNFVNLDKENSLNELKNWLTTNAIVDAEFASKPKTQAEERYIEFMDKRNLNGRTILKTRHDQSRLERKHALAERLANDKWDVTKYSKQDIKDFPELFIEIKGADGKMISVPRNDIDKQAEEVSQQLSEIDDLLGVRLFQDELMIAEEDFDIYAAKERKKDLELFAAQNKTAQTEWENTQYEARQYFGKNLEDIGEEDIKNQTDYVTAMQLYDKAVQAKNVQQTASDLWLNAKTYLDLKQNKSIQDDFVDQWTGFGHHVAKDLNQGQACQQILAQAMDIDLSNSKDVEQSAKEIVSALLEKQEYGTSRAMHRVLNKGGWDKWKTFFKDPLELGFSLTVGSLTSMLPYGWQIVGSSVATGAGTGWGLGKLGYLAGPTGNITAPGGAAVGAMWGLRSGMAATMLAMEYTNSILDVMSEKGYDLMNPDDVAQGLQDGSVWSEGGERGIKRGVPIAMVDFFTAGLAGKVFSPARYMTSRTGERIMLMGAEHLAFGPGGEMLGEAAAQFTAGQDVNLDEIYLEGMGSMGGNFSNLAYNTYETINKNKKIEYAESMRDIASVMNESTISLERLSNWTQNMHDTGQIDSETANKIQKNIGVRRDVDAYMKNIYDVDQFRLAATDKDAPTADAKQDIRLRLAALTQARNEYENEPSVYSSQINDINKEIAHITTTGTLSATPVAIVNTQVEYSVNGQQMNKFQMERYLDNATAEQLTNDIIEFNNAPPAMQEKLNQVSQDLLIKEKQDAIQESSATSVDVQEQPTDGQRVGVGDTGGSQITETITQEEKVDAEGNVITEESDVTTQAEVQLEEGKEVTEESIDNNLSDETITPESLSEENIFTHVTQSLDAIKNWIEGGQVLGKNEKLEEFDTDVAPEGKLSIEKHNTNVPNFQKGGLYGGKIGKAKFVVVRKGQENFTPNSNRVNQSSFEKSTGIGVLNPENRGIENFEFYKVTPDGNLQKINVESFSKGKSKTDKSVLEDTTIETISKRLQKAFPNVKISTSKEAWTQLSSDPTFKIKKVKGKSIAGITAKGEIFINPDAANVDTPIHEFGHIWTDYLRSEASGNKGTQLLEKGLSLVEGTEAYEAAKKDIGEYDADGNLTNNEEVKEEALTTLISDKGETIVNEAQKKSFKTWLNDMFKYIKDTFIKSADIKMEDIENLTIEEFQNIALADLFSEKPLSKKFDPTAKGLGKQRMQAKKSQKAEGKAKAEAKAEGKAKAEPKTKAKPKTKPKAKPKAETKAETTQQEAAAPREFTADEVMLLEYITEKRKEGYSNKDLKKMIAAEFKDKKWDFAVEVTGTDNKVRVVTAPQIDALLEVDIPSVAIQTRNAIITLLNEKLPEILTNVIGGAKEGQAALSRVVTEIRKYSKEKTRTPIQIRAELLRLIKKEKAYEDANSVNKKRLEVELDALFDISEGAILTRRMEELNKQIEQRRLGKAELKKEQNLMMDLFKKLYPTEVPKALTQLWANIRDYSQSVHKSTVDGLTRIVNEKIESIRRATIKNIGKIILFNAKLKKKDAKIRTKGRVSAEGQMFFARAAEVFAAATNKIEATRDKMLLNLGMEVLKTHNVQTINADGKETTTTQLKYGEYTEDTMDALQKQSLGYELTYEEQRLVDLSIAFDLMHNIENMSLEQVSNLFETFKDIKQVYKNELTQKIMEKARKRQALKEGARKSILENFGELVFTDTLTTEPLNKVQQEQYTDIATEAFAEAKNKTDIVYINKDTKKKIVIGQEAEVEIDVFGEKIRLVVKVFDADSTGKSIEPITNIYIKRKGVATEQEMRLRFSDAASLREQRKFTELITNMWTQFKANPLAYLNTSFAGLGKGKMTWSLFQNLDTMMQFMDNTGTFFHTYVSKAMDKMHSNKQKYIVEYIRAFDEVANKIPNVTKGIKQVITLAKVREWVKIPMADGTTTAFNGSQMMRILALSRNPQELKRMMNNKNPRVRVTAETIAAIEKHLGKDLVNFVDGVIEVLGNDFEAVNAVFKSVNNVSLPKLENYYPTKTDQGETKRPTYEDIKTAEFSSNFSAGFFSAIQERRSPDSDVLLVGEGFFSNLESHYLDMARFKAYAEGVQDLNTLFTDKATQNALKIMGVYNISKFIINVSINPASLESNTIGRQVIDFAYDVFVSYVLGFKAIQMIKQTMSYILAFKKFRSLKNGNEIDRVIDKIPLVSTAIDLINFHRMVIPMWFNWGKTKRLMKAISADFELRYDADLLVNLESPTGATGKSLIEPSAFGRDPIGAIQSWIRYTRQVGAAFTKGGDAGGIVGYLALYKQALADGKTEEQALEVFEEYNKTQQTRATHQLTYPQLQKNFFTRAVVSFASSGILMMQQIMTTSRNIVRDVFTGKIPKEEDVRGFALNAFIGNFFYQMATYGATLLYGSKADDERTWERIIDASLFSTITMGLPVLGGVMADTIRFARGDKNPFEKRLINPFYEWGRKAYRYTATPKYARDTSEIAGLLIGGFTGINVDPVIGAATFAATFGSDKKSDRQVDNLLRAAGISKTYRPVLFGEGGELFDLAILKPQDFEETKKAIKEEEESLEKDAAELYAAEEDEYGAEQQGISETEDADAKEFYQNPAYPFKKAGNWILNSLNEVIKKYNGEPKRKSLPVRNRKSQ